MTAWNNFLDEIDRKKLALKCSYSGAWYRGLTKSVSYSLLPTLFRQIRKPNAEANLYKGYIRTRMAFQGVNPWLNLIDMQHYGTPTRLLDWTECFGVALYFALDKYDPACGELPCIWILNPFSLSCRAKGNNNKEIGDFHLHEDTDYYRCFVKQDKKWLYKYPMPFYAPAPNERIRSQHGFFTVQGSDEMPIEKSCARHLGKVEIQLAAHNDAKRFLELAGISKETMFPDTEGWLHKVQSEYFY